MENSLEGEVKEEEPEESLKTEDFLAMDAADVQQLKDMLAGRIDFEWVYDVRGKKQLTLIGIDECFRAYCRKHGKTPELRLLSTGYTPDGKWFTVAMVIHDPNTGITFHGGAEGEIGKEFWYRAALAKAERNAMRKVLPNDFLREVIDLAVGMGKVKKLGRPAASPPIPGPVGEDHEAGFAKDVAEAKVKEAKQRYYDAVVAMGGTHGDQAEMALEQNEREAGRELAEAEKELEKLSKPKTQTPPSDSSGLSPQLALMTELAELDVELDLQMAIYKALGTFIAPGRDGKLYTNVPKDDISQMSDKWAGSILGRLREFKARLTPDHAGQGKVALAREVNQEHAAKRAAAPKPAAPPPASDDEAPWPEAE